jgi:uncharacterized protein YndB with AHSA1/START domain
MKMSVDEQAYGILERGGDRPVLRFDRYLPHPRERVWRALTEDEHLEAWFPTTIEGDRAAGASLIYRHRHADLPPMEGEMLAFDPPSLLELSWGGDRVRFELRPDGDGTALALIVEMQEFGKLARDGAGWHVCLEALASEIAGKDAAPYSPDHWRELFTDYGVRLGPEAATLGPPQEWKDEYGDVA